MGFRKKALVKAKLMGLTLFTGIIILALSGCDDSIPDPDMTAPAEAVTFNVATGDEDGQVVLTWTAPADSDFDHVVITYTPGTTQKYVGNFSKADQTVMFTGLDKGTEYTFTLKTVDKAGNTSAGKTATAIAAGTAYTPPDPAPDPSPVPVPVPDPVPVPVPVPVPPLTPALQKIAGLRASSYRSDDLTNARVRLDWYNDISGDFSQVKITYTHNREDRTEIIPRKDGPKGDQSHAITGLLTGTRYTFTVQTMDSAGNTGPGASIGVNTPDTLDLTPPGVVSNLTAVGTDKGATLKWDNPSDFDHVEVMYWSPGDDASTIYDVGIVDTYVVSGLINPVGTEPYQWQFSVRTVDTSGNASRWVQAWAKLIDRDPPRQVSGLRAVPSYGKVTLYWRDPFDSDFAYAEIYVEKTSPTPGVMVHDWHDVGRSTNSYGSNSKEYTGLTNDSEYTFTIRTYDTSGNVDTAAQLSIKATPFDDIPPGEVRNLQITTGETEVVLTWLNPTDADFDHVVITRTLLPFGPTTTSIIPSTPSTSLSHRSSGMITGKDYRFIVQTVDRDGNTSIGLYREVTPRDLTPPGEVTYLSVTFNIITYILEEVVHEYPGGRLDIYWTPPTDRDFDHVLITVWRGGTKLFSVNGTTRDSTGRYLGEAYNVRGQYTVLIQTVDRDGNKSSGLTRVVGQ